jgi:Ca2+-binding RTX toxin-like protein
LRGSLRAEPTIHFDFNGRNFVMALNVDSTEQVSMGSNPYVQALLNSGWKWDSTDGVAQIHYTFDGFDNTARTALVAAANTWASVANIEFSAASRSGTAEIYFQETTNKALDYYGYSGTPYEATDLSLSHNGHETMNGFTISNEGQVHTLLGYDAPPFKQGVDAGDGGFEVMIHEIGHALGLKHPHDDGAENNNHVSFPGVDSTYDLGDNRLNQAVYSVMSYDTHYDPNNDNILDYAGYIKGPMAFDIAAIQQLYGAREHVSEGDDFYSLDNPNIGWKSIWDTGGTDTIGYSGTSNAVIDLRPATLDDTAGGGGMLSCTSRHLHGVTLKSHVGYTIAGDIKNVIADENGMTGVIIENAAGGSGNDRLTGNSVDNDLTGNGGSDTLSGGFGDDHLDGGVGRDSMSGSFGDDTYEVSSHLDRVTELRFRGIDTVNSRISYTLTTNVENLSLQGDVGLSGTGNAGANTITGNSGANTLTGLDGDDRLGGLGGNDLLLGGEGADTFVFNKAGGNDCIRDFSVADGDKIDLSNIDGMSYAKLRVLLFAHTEDSHGGTTIHLDDTDSIYLNRIHAASLDSGDFIV